MKKPDKATNSIEAVILVGGKGTRIQSLYPDRPKCLVPVAGKPFLLWQIEWLRSAGIRRIHLAAGHMAEVLQAWTETNAPPDMEITMSVEPEPLGTAGAIRFAAPWIISNPFFVINGDTLAPELNFSKMRAAQTNGSELTATIGIGRCKGTGRYGTVESDADNRVTAFLEKADRKQGWINTGVYCMNKRVLDFIPADRNLSVETDVFPELARTRSLMAYTVSPPLLDMGTPEGLQTTTDWLRSQAVHQVKDLQHPSDMIPST